MSNLIVGHVTTSTARIWVRGDRKSKAARLRYRPAAGGGWVAATVPLVDFRGFVEVVELQGLSPSTRYECELSYQAGSAPPVKAAAFATPPASPERFSFILGSCNWSRGGLVQIGDARASWEGIRSLIQAKSPAFMIHCGDQIYADIPGTLPQFMNLRYYRDLYLKSWKLKPTAEVLAALPHYMILDDHEIFDDFHNGKPYVGESSDTIRDFAKVAYREYQHSRNPQSFSPDFHFSFEWAGAQFFAVDVRTERHKGDNATIMSTQQMARLKDWLAVNKAKVKFVVTSVPFVGEVRTGDDKWCSRSFRAQRDEIIDFIARNGVSRLVFLTGDMHCSYHATMKITNPAGGEILVHELMSSPINQVANGMHSFVADVTSTTPGNIPYTVGLKEDEFYGKHSNVMLITAKTTGEVSWEIYRTKDPAQPVPPPPGAPWVFRV
jgi:phosphodiesterase/alkaline phosphatase D-like protein